MLSEIWCGNKSFAFVHDISCYRYDNYMYQTPNGYAYPVDNPSLEMVQQASPENNNPVYSPQSSPTTPNPVGIMRPVDLMDSGIIIYIDWHQFSQCKFCRNAERQTKISSVWQKKI